ncbi:unnamed protein product [Owenia fusiformis]|uniref:Uncharacterized protein n=1 Tax=Owenia fusiformis TaxID=6347 RepID=A0A8S4Q0K0_OWEFU|nr:unnamed protein product [Owenia fusiformis]
MTMNTRSLLLLLFCLMCSLFVTVAGPVNQEEKEVKQSTTENKDSNKNAPDAIASETIPTTTNNGTVLKTTTLRPENCTGKFDNESGICIPIFPGSSSIMEIYKNNKDMIKRTLYVLLGATGLVIIYFIVKTIRLRRRKSKTRKYGYLRLMDTLNNIDI